MQCFLLNAAHVANTNHTFERKYQIDFIRLITPLSFSDVCIWLISLALSTLSALCTICKSGVSQINSFLSYVPHLPKWRIVIPVVGGGGGGRETVKRGWGSEGG